MTTKLNWSSYEPLTKSKVDKVTESGGVYRLARGGETYGVFYVGKTENLKSRLNDHLDDKDDDCIKTRVAKGNCYFKYAELTGDKNRSGAERTLYDHFSDKNSGPPCNKQKPNEDPLDINIK